MFTLPDLPYDYSSLEPFIDTQTMQIHHDKHHAAYVKNLNDALTGHDELLNMPIEELLQNLDKVPEDIRTKVKNNGGGHFNHSFFWTILKVNQGKGPEGQLLELINSSFDSFDAFKEQFSKSALGVFGSGWAWVIKEGDKLKIMTTPNQDSPISSGINPILGLDVWEHSYYLKYQNRRAEYIEAFWNVLDWEEVAKRV